MKKANVFIVVAVLGVLFAIPFANDLKDTLLNPEKIQLVSSNHINNSGESSGYSERFYQGVWTVSFTSLDGHTNLPLIIQNSNHVKVSSTLRSGELKVIITQGKFLTSKVETINLSGKEFEDIFDLTNWEDGEITIWVIGNHASDGNVTIKLIEQI